VLTNSEEEPESQLLCSSSDVKDAAAMKGAEGSLNAAAAEEGGWEVLPEELWVHIFTFLNVKDLFVVSLVNKCWKQLVEVGTM